MAFSDDDLRTYQQQAVRAIAEADEDYKSLILPTGAGKTRVGLAYASNILDKKDSVAYITQTNAHVGQVLSESDAIGVDAVHIPGRSAESQGDGGSGDREIDIQDYNIGFKVGVFSYAGYFLGSEVPTADTLIIDDAHAFTSEHVTHSAVILHRDDWGRQYDRLIDLIKDENPILESEIESLQQPIHRGGGTVLVPPPDTTEVEQAITSSVESMSEADGWEPYLLQKRLNASPDFVNWPCVITANTISWRPFILPFQSFGRSPNRDIEESELVAMTSIRDPEEFLQTRLGTPELVTKIEPPEPVDEMGSRVVVPYRDQYDRNPPSEGQINTINRWADRFGSVLVSVASHNSAQEVMKRLHKKDINPIEYESEISVQELQEQEEPRALVLVNKPSGIDISSSICPVAIHLDLPHSTSGHEVVAGDIEESGAVAEASLAVRLSQLLGRLNRSDEDRSIHLLLADGLPLRRGTAFVKSLDPAVLTDLLIGRRGIAQEYELPTETGLLDDAEAFLNGDDSLRSSYITDPEQLRKLFLGSDVEGFSPGTIQQVEANLFAARGNFTRAAKQFERFSQNAEEQGYPDHSSFYDFQSIVYGSADTGSTSGTLNRSTDAIVDAALDRNPQSGALVAALRQIQSSEETDTQQARIEMRVKQQKRQAFYCFTRWYDEADGNVPDRDHYTSVDPWKEYWRSRFAKAEHSELTSAYSEAFELLGTDTPQREKQDNDLRIRWETENGEEFILAVEIKGWNPDTVDSEPDLKSDNIRQARTNARKIDADAALLASSRSGRTRDVPGSAETYGVHCLNGDASVAFADMMAEQCAILATVEQNQIDRNQVPLCARRIQKLLESDGRILDGQEIRALIDLE
ncbi:putative helicase (plasmid) [Haloarcula marismortui ATCC 43049]|uniref:Helicase n=1 Tax=Haloarcula marismortui (strain ATCC 43049 / DSM 3752 / JCM 8966 / VKM B-1809) TaxID=272569 RepID=Q5V893_HALMA|nr:DEAD/DEAH box helicase family protein [Haloarcula marismortui]AAV44293.1 putative helicase [Haloarcula marismortui ATCC 43049]QCP89407.1 helicase [Haloarcula marismortui ATCC 43049]